MTNKELVFVLSCHVYNSNMGKKHSNKYNHQKKEAKQKKKKSPFLLVLKTTSFNQALLDVMLLVK